MIPIGGTQLFLMQYEECGDPIKGLKHWNYQLHLQNGRDFDSPSSPSALSLARQKPLPALSFSLSFSTFNPLTAE